MLAIADRKTFPILTKTKSLIILLILLYFFLYFRLTADTSPPDEFCKYPYLSENKYDIVMYMTEHVLYKKHQL